MAILSSDILIFLSGAASDGAAQTDPALSLGGFRSATQPTSGADNNLLDDVSGSEASAGDTEYRCYFYKNSHASLPLTSAKFYIDTATGNAQDAIAFAIEVPTTSDTTGSVQTIINESTSPVVNTGNCSNWSTATTYAGGVAVNINAHDTEMSISEIIGVWIRRVVSAGASAVNAETVTIACRGDTGA